MSQDALKKLAAETALQEIEEGQIVGVGTGSTVNFFIDALAEKKHLVEACVSSSEASTERLKKHGIPVLELNYTGDIPVYIDGADETNSHKQLIKGGGGALTREKIVAAAAKKFICIVDESKVVGTLGAFPLPVEVIPMARSLVARKLLALGGQPEWRENVVTDNGNLILDVYNLSIQRPIEMETKINQIPGVVTVGLFAERPADTVIIASADGIKTL